MIDPNSGETKSSINIGTLPRAIDYHVGEDKLVVGLRTGSIVEIDCANGHAMKTLMQSHNDGEVWGLDLAQDMVFTTGDDNQVKKWDPNSRKCVETSKVNEKSRKAKRNKASTMGKHPESQCARAVAVSCNGDMAVCANDGSVTIRKLEAMGEVIKEIEDSLEWIETAEFSPDG